MAISAVVTESVVRGLAALVIGLAISVVGIDGASGTSRFTFGLPELFDGIDIVVITVGLLALGEVFSVAARRGTPDETKLLPSTGRLWLSFRELRQALPAWLRGTAIGIPFGIIPVGGSEVPTFLSYGAERKLDGRRKKPMFGRGAIQGVAGPEAAGNATAGTAMGALLALGPSDLGHRGDPARGLPAVRTAAGPCCSTARPTSCGLCWRASSSAWSCCSSSTSRSRRCGRSC